MDHAESRKLSSGGGEMLVNNEASRHWHDQRTQRRQRDSMHTLSTLKVERNAKLVPALVQVLAFQQT